MKILTNHWGQEASPTWRSVTTYLSPPKGHDLLSSLRFAARLYARRLDFDCVVLGAGRSDFIFALLQSILPFRKVPCVFIDCLWQRDHNKVRHLFNKMIRKIVNRTVDKFIVWASREVDTYSQAFGLPREKFVFVPYHTTFAEHSDIEPVEGDYIFSGGNSLRDYKSLIEAVRGLPVKLCIASTRKELFSNISIPENVDIKGYSHKDYTKKFEGCRIHVVSLISDPLHSAGQQTFLNSMWLGKPTIVTDPEGGNDYIKHGEDGLLVPPNDDIALREAIMMLWNDPKRAQEMGRKAAKKARKYTTEEHFKKIVSVVDEVINEKSEFQKTLKDKLN